jgi:hypothetical protein
LAVTVREQLAEIYARIPKIACKKLCAACCGPVPAFPPELRAIAKHAPNRNPPKKADRLTCPRLDMAFGTCTVYADRPTLCRLWGVVESMPCDHGCKPERVLTDAESREILQAVRALANGVVDLIS